jgi:hypothetical protein
LPKEGGPEFLPGIRAQPPVVVEPIELLTIGFRVMIREVECQFLGPKGNVLRQAGPKAAGLSGAVFRDIPACSGPKTCQEAVVSLEKRAWRRHLSINGIEKSH